MKGGYCRFDINSFIIRTLPSVEELHPIGPHALLSRGDFADFYCRYGITLIRVYRSRSPNPKDIICIFIKMYVSG